MKRFSAIFCLFFAVIAMFAQEESPITWNASVRMTSERDGVLYIRANIEPGWHLYSTSLPDGGPKATSFGFAGTAGINFNGPVKAKTKSVEKLDPQFGINLTFYEETALFTRSFSIDPEVAEKMISIKVTFMGCNDETCLPPRTVSLSVHQNKFRKLKKNK